MTGQVAVLDMLCTGRLRFDAASSMIVNALRDGFMEGEGRFYKQPQLLSGHAHDTTSTGASMP